MSKILSTELITKSGRFKVGYHKFNGELCLSLSYGDITKPNPIVRLHSSCLFSEAFRSIDCDCNLQLTYAMDLIAKKGSGVIIYLFQEGRGHGLDKKIQAMEVERAKKIDTVEAFNELHFDLDPRKYDIAIKALKKLQVNKSIVLATNNPRKKNQLEKGGFKVSGRAILKYPTNKRIKEYLKVKKTKLGHKIPKELLA